MKFLSLILLILVSCAKPKQSSINTSIKNPEITPLIDLFYSKAIENGFNPNHFAKISLGYDFNDGSFFNNNSTTIAICKVEGDKGFVAINPQYWANFLDLDKKILLYHELGHCLLGLGHTEINDKKDISTNIRTFARVPTSIMYPIHLGEFFSPNEHVWLESILDSDYLPKLFGSGSMTAFSSMASSSQTYTISLDGCDHLVEEINEDL